MSNKRHDVDYTTSPVDKAGRKSNLSMFMVMLGFTFFSASMWVGQQLADGLNFWDFLWALLLGGLILVPIVSLITPKMDKRDVDPMFTCYDTKVVVRAAENLSE